MMMGKVPKIIRPAMLFLGVAVLLGLICPVAQAKSYNINQLGISARLHEDGSLEVTESRTYVFRGAFTFAYRDLPASDSVTYGDFRVSESGRPYRMDTSQEPGTYAITRSSGNVRVTWYYSARDEARTFDLHYRVAGAIARYRDVAVLYYKFVGEDWALAQDNITVTLTPPSPVSREAINEWVHGPLWAESRIRSDGTILISCRHLPANTYLEIRALYPPDLFAGLEPRMQDVRPGIMAEEARWAEAANRQRKRAAERLAARAKRIESGKWIVLGICVAGVGLWGWIFAAFRRKPRVGRMPGITSEIPEQTPPALLDYLLNDRRISVGALIGTMLDLARRGFVKLREEQVEKKKIFGGTKMESEYHWDLDRTHLNKHAGELTNYESDILGFIFDELAEGHDTISLDTMKKKRSEFVGFFRKWTKQVKAEAEKHEWFDRHSVRGFYYSLAIGIVMMLIAIPAAIYLGLWGVALIIAGGAVLVLSFSIPHRTAEGETKARQWKAVRRYLKKYEFRTADRSDLLTRISDYLVYGVVLGLSPGIYEELAAYMPEGKQSAYVPWYVYAGGGRGGFSPAAFGQAFSSMVATATSSMSTAAGTGGGASGGGGGGAGGGGGGAG
jgi:uncharacterized membrane protein